MSSKKRNWQVGDLRDGEPCGHPGCLNHISHPCKGCGRVGGVRSNATRVITKEIWVDNADED